MRLTREDSNGRKLSKGALLAITSAAALGGAAAYVHWRTEEAEKKNPPSGKFIDVGGVTLHYIDRGLGPCIILFHGNGTMIQDFELSGLVDLAARHYRVIVFDRPGYGYSTRPRATWWTADAQAKLFHEAFRTLHLEQPIVIGHSWGAFVALAMGIRFPQALRGIVLASGYYYPTARFDVPAFAGPAIPVIGDVMRYTISPLIGRLMWNRVVRYLFDPSPVTERFKQFPMWMALRPSQLRASAEETVLMLPNTFALRPRYEELSVPTVLFAGAGDRHVDTRKQSERFHEQFRDTKLITVPQGGHMVHQVAPDKLLEAIDSVAAMAPQEAKAR